MQADSSDTNVASPTPTPVAYVPTTRDEVIKVIGTGVISGILIALLGSLIAAYIIAPVFCNNTGQGAFGVCASGGVVAEHIAAILVGFGAFLLLTRWTVYRALLLVVAVTIAMWGLKKYADPLTAGSWLEYYLFAGLLYGLGYALFYWILRLRQFAVSLVLTVVSVAASCWAMVAW